MFSNKLCIFKTVTNLKSVIILYWLGINFSFVRQFLSKITFSPIKTTMSSKHIYSGEK